MSPNVNVANIFSFLIWFNNRNGVINGSIFEHRPLQMQAKIDACVRVMESIDVAYYVFRYLDAGSWLVMRRVCTFWNECFEKYCDAHAFMIRLGRRLGGNPAEVILEHHDLRKCPRPFLLDCLREQIRIHGLDAYGKWHKFLRPDQKEAAYLFDNKVDDVINSSSLKQIRKYGRDIPALMTDDGLAAFVKVHPEFTPCAIKRGLPIWDHYNSIRKHWLRCPDTHTLFLDEFIRNVSNFKFSWRQMCGECIEHVMKAHPSHFSAAFNSRCFKTIVRREAFHLLWEMPRPSAPMTISEKWLRRKAYAQGLAILIYRMPDLFADSLRHFGRPDSIDYDAIKISIYLMICVFAIAYLIHTAAS